MKLKKNIDTNEIKKRDGTITDCRPKCPNCENKHMNYSFPNENNWRCSLCKNDFNVAQGLIIEMDRFKKVSS